MLPKTYRALRLREPGPITNFVMESLPLKAPGPGEVVIKVGACAIAFRDVLDRQGAFKFINRPTVLGHEFAGTIAAVGEGVARRKVGDNVCSLHWDQDAAWPSPLNKVGAVDSMFGLTCDGGYAEYVTAKQGSVVTAPNWLSAVEASSIMSTFGTVWEGAITRGGLCGGQRVLVTGASGGVGSAAVSLCKALKCEVTGVTSSSAKADYVKSLGCDDVVVAGPSGEFKAKPHDMVIECVGGPTFAGSLRATAPGGKIILLGNVENSKVSLPLGFCILNSVSIVGSDSIRAAGFENELAPFMQHHKLKPEKVTVKPLEEAGQAHDDLEKRRVCGRIVLQVDPEASKGWPAL